MNVRTFKLLPEYVDYSIRCAQLMETDEKKFIELMQAEEDRYLDLIESNEWKLVDEETGKTFGILIPNFTSITELNWRWS